jgi:nitrous oxidase accessory protein NosD
MTVKKRFLLLIVGLLGAFFVGVGQAAATGGSTFIVDDDGFASPPSNCNSAMPTNNKIEAAVEAAPPYSTINVCPGTYEEQVSFETDDDGTTIRSLVRRAAIIKAPATIVANLADEMSIVHVNSAYYIRILAFTIAGPGPGPCNTIHYGVWVENGGSATIDDNHVTDVRDQPFSGCQNGTGIQVGRKYTDGPTQGIATITRNLIDDYQKNGITVDNGGSRATIEDNVVVGAGATPVIAQNGIQISRGAWGNVRENQVSDNGPYAVPALASSSGILLYGNQDPMVGDPSPAPGTTVANNVVFRNDDNIPAYGTQYARILYNQVTDSTFYDGIYMGSDSAENRIEGNFLRRNTEHDCHDDSNGTGTAGTANFWINNDGVTENRPGLCQGAHGDDDEDAEDDEDGEDHNHQHHNGNHGDGHGDDD